MNKSNDSKNSARRRRVLVASILIAGVITIGGTFAWFGSEDSVTNKLTSTSNYGVSLVEDFTPPKNWVPGQNVNKTARVTNTGNVDAFAKVTLSNFIDVKTDYTGALIWSRFSSSTIDDFTLVNLKKTLSTEADQKGRELVVISSTEDKNEDEIKSIQAGGRLIYGNTNTKANRSFGIISGSAEEVGTDFKPYNSGLYIFEREVSANNTTDSTSKITTTTYTYEYSGYYFVKDSNGKAGEGTYYAINLPKGSIVRSDTDHNVVSEVHISGATKSGSENYTASDGISLKTTKLYQNQPLYFDCSADNKSGDNATSTMYIYSEGSGKYYLKARYDGPDGVAGTKDDIIIRIYLNDNYPATSGGTTVTAGLGTNWSLNATYMYDNGSSKNKKIDNATFYLNQVLLAGKTSEPVITGVELDNSVDSEAYVSFDYNLTLNAKSVQVVYDSDGNITTGTDLTSAKGVNTEWASDPAQVTAINKDDSGTYKVTWNLTSNTTN